MIGLLEKGAIVIVFVGIYQEVVWGNEFIHSLKPQTGFWCVKS